MTRTLTQEVRNVAMTDPRFLAEEIKPPRPITVLHRANPHRVCTMNHSDTDTDQGSSDPAERVAGTRSNSGQNGRRQVFTCRQRQVGVVCF